MITAPCSTPHETPEGTTHYAAHDDAGIFGIGTSPEGAIADATWQTGEDCSDLTATRISRALYRLIWEAGWNPQHDRFAVTEDGELVDTTTRYAPRRARVRF